VYPQVLACEDHRPNRARIPSKIRVVIVFWSFWMVSNMTNSCVCLPKKQELALGALLLVVANDDEHHRFWCISSSWSQGRSCSYSLNIIFRKNIGWSVLGRKRWCNLHGSSAVRASDGSSRNVHLRQPCCVLRWLEPLLNPEPLRHMSRLHVTLEQRYCQYCAPAAWSPFREASQGGGPTYGSLPEEGGLR
jgi:hypothetical protein